MELLLPEVRPPALALPSYVKLDMAFGVGAGGQLFDKSRYRSHGAINGPDWAAGLHGYCLDFDRTVPDYVLIPAAHTQLNFTAEDFSFVLRIRWDITAFNCCLFERGNLNTEGYMIFMTAGGRLDFYTNQALANQASRTALGDFVINTWYTVGISRTGNSVRIYRNGVDMTATVGVHINPLNSNRTAQIGVRDGLAGDPFDGKIEFLRVFGGVALTASEHLAWHRALA